jgi:transposase
VPTWKLTRALLLQVFYSIRSEPQLMEQIRCNRLFRWFVDGISARPTRARSDIS